MNPEPANPEPAVGEWVVGGFFLTILGLMTILIIVSVIKDEIRHSRRYRDKLSKQAKLTCLGCTFGVTTLWPEEIKPRVNYDSFRGWYLGGLANGTLCCDCFTRAQHLQDLEKGLLDE